MGALGNETARILGQSGVGNFILCDPDRIEESNLSRTPLFRLKDVGNSKVAVAARALKEMDSAIRVETRATHLIHGVGLAELRDASLVVSCLDSRVARLQLAGRCRLVGAPLVDGGTHPWGGEVRPYLEPDGPCYGCAVGELGRGESDQPWSCADASNNPAVPSAAPSSALVGTWMAMVAIRFLMNLKGPAGTIVVDGAQGTSSIVRQVRDPACPMHEPIGPAERIAATNRDTLGDLKKQLQAGEIPLAWEAVQRGVLCLACGYEEQRWGRLEQLSCPRCGRSLLPRTTLELGDAPEHLTLENLGIAPREILTLRMAGGLRWVELSK